MKVFTHGARWNLTVVTSLFKIYNLTLTCCCFRGLLPVIKKRISGRSSKRACISSIKNGSFWISSIAINLTESTRLSLMREGRRASWLRVSASNKLKLRSAFTEFLIIHDFPVRRGPNSKTLLWKRSVSGLNILLY